MFEINKIYNMDCLDGMDLMVKQGLKVDAVITDPPYGTTNCKWDSVIPFEDMWDKLKKVRKDNTPILLFGTEPFSSMLRLSNLKEYKYDWIWKKERGLGFLNAKKMPLRDTENISVFYKKLPLYNPQMRSGKPYTAVNRPDKQKGINNPYNQVVTENKGERFPLTTLEFNRPIKTFHPTQKPTALIEYLIKTYTNEGDLVLDFTIGSGTTAIACINTNRNFIGFELDKEYYEIAKNRINKHIIDNNLQDKYNLIA